MWYILPRYIEMCQNIQNITWNVFSSQLLEMFFPVISILNFTMISIEYIKYCCGSKSRDIALQLGKIWQNVIKAKKLNYHRRWNKIKYLRQII